MAPALYLDTSAVLRAVLEGGTLDALHLATYLLARRHIGNLELLTADCRLTEAAGGM